MSDPEASTSESKPVVVYIVPTRIQKKRLKDIKSAARRKKLSVVESFCPKVTHIVSELDNRYKVARKLKIVDYSILKGIELLRLTWFTACIKKAEILPVEDEHRIPEPPPEAESAPPIESLPQITTTEWACQRATPLRHFNEIFCNALEVLQMKAEFIDSGQDHLRSLAFRRASCVLKSLPFMITNVKQVKGQKDIGGHSRQVIKEILAEGFATEVEETLKDPWFQKVKIFSTIFGVGPATAKIWVEQGVNTVAEALVKCERKNWMVQWGLAFHDDLKEQVQLIEAENLTAVIKAEAERILPGVIVTLTGGFRRGKSAGHDVDLLFSHPEEGKEVNFLPKLLTQLEQRSLILCGKLEKSSYGDRVLSRDYNTKGHMDHYEKWIGLMKLPKRFCHEKINPSEYRFLMSNNAPVRGIETCTADDYEPHSKKQRLCEGEPTPLSFATAPRTWIARRVDLVIAPYSMYHYALLGWTGSKQFNRDIRLYSQKTLNQKLTSHGLWNFEQNKKLPAASEEEIFQHLNLSYLKPSDRNC
ncbi:DNA-directed DNA/RNA polymerase mu-like [Ylistrum balloti]|uniref:DNA-directed DNA/RNA polymerase mu-like n=1 Tax=Ylistrum balloti TaxID=509963 RepID=UPI002905D2FF|nr:DNA-directed DNA/RNA polymerase mu-like [Ylistrum balloti]